MANSKDVSDSFKKAGVSVKGVAGADFGSATEDFATGMIPGGSGGDSHSNPKATRKPSEWVATSYAAALAGSTDFRPKLKFLFKVEFRFKAEVLQAYPELNSNDFTFMIKSVDRPKVDFEYEDDVNVYNFRTKVLKKIRHRELTITFMDDTGNRVFDFFRTLLLIHSPVTRGGYDRDGSERWPSSSMASTGNGMSFRKLGDKSSKDLAHRGVINTNFGGAIESIRVKQMYVNPGKSKIAEAVGGVSYDFLNPRLVSFDLDDLSHESSDPSLLTMQFDYDWMELVKIGAPLTGPGMPGYDHIKAPYSAGVPSSDILVGRPQQPVDAGPGGGWGILGKAQGIFGNAAGGALSKVTGDAVSKAFTAVGGKGTLATAIGGRLSGAIGNSASTWATGSATSLLGSAASSVGDFALSAGSKVKAAYNSRNSGSGVVADSAAGTPAAATVTASVDVSGEFPDGI